MLKIITFVPRLLFALVRMAWHRKHNIPFHVDEEIRAIIIQQERDLPASAEIIRMLYPALQQANPDRQLWLQDANSPFITDEQQFLLSIDIRGQLCVGPQKTPVDIADPEQLWQELAKLGLSFDAPTLAQP